MLFKVALKRQQAAEDAIALGIRVMATGEHYPYLPQVGVNINVLDDGEYQDNIIFIHYTKKICIPNYISGTNHWATISRSINASTRAFECGKENQRCFYLYIIKKTS